MAAGAEGTISPSDYINHHLSNLKVHYEGFGTVHWDSVITAWVLGALVFGLLWMVSRAVTSNGVPSKVQSLVEMIYEFVDNQVKDIYHGDRKFIVGVAFTVFLWVLSMNMMKFLPPDFVAETLKLFKIEHWKPVPTADINTTLALSLSVISMVIFFSFKAKGFGGYLHELFMTPFHANNIIGKIVLLPLNFLFQLIELLSKPLSLALRLYGNMYAGEIIFLLISMMAAAGVGGVIGGALLHAGWAIFHILVVPLQAFVFMMLTAVYIAMAHEHH